MKIGIVCYPTYGGSGVVATELGKALAHKGHYVHFITYRQPPRLSALAFETRTFYHEVSFYEYPLFEYAPYSSALTSKIVDVVRHEKLDLVHVHYAIPHASAAYMAQQILKTHGIYMPFITTLHGTDITLVGKDATFEPIVTFSINASDGITAVSESLKKQTYQYFNIPKDIAVIPNFIDLSAFKKHNKEHFKKAIAPNGERIIMHTSTFRPVKRIDDVMQVFYQIYQQIPSKLLLVGDGPERAKAEQFCRDKNLCNDVLFLGKQDAIGELLAVTDLFLLPSESESFGLVALEAMACEVPVISSNTGGIPEINIHGQTGFLSDVGNINEMAQNAIMLLQNNDLLQEFRKNALQRATQFDLHKILPLYENYYLTVIERAKKANYHLNNYAV
ncbi:MAG: N-acetyl-alpha-D-glucosaminyl L-malate synthase BshA [Sphingobacteriales bacterium]|jgi:N-acetyl-alpha-D-glucosaminyl L-malate synthase BshA|nr:N-acetyl-alpha-D-glucosaminyl L-malate synthase BshA [Sphingobacteriales bacterium]MBP9140087.1 N-acetyl-alpha-D-glucosaminyl L-malate synthase BshA [Chitinophagales bacterium]MDA0197830.1 N-acetyl-alpha-D-glucosaminyl L-malate synthase BshA [Bacteroidota bacterium]MBK7527528.1 N-acetyl-alpha-D-glucosaminyl L-malate synthase BshA [Sphingobacteriales bacterium]MBL0248992.1 N-acetyl-alpha-D-glucosaminyl L-malate synthase BshA [Sphingobacteriales bacterium]